MVFVFPCLLRGLAFTLPYLRQTKQEQNETELITIIIISERPGISSWPHMIHISLGKHFINELYTLINYYCENIHFNDYLKMLQKLRTRILAIPLLYTHFAKQLFYVH